jgi:hypothetical protein
MRNYRLLQLKSQVFIAKKKLFIADWVRRFPESFAKLKDRTKA